MSQKRKTHSKQKEKPRNLRRIFFLHKLTKRLLSKSSKLLQTDKNPTNRLHKNNPKIRKRLPSILRNKRQSFIQM